MEDGSHQQEAEVDASGIVKPLSAYLQYQKLNIAKIRDEILKEGREITPGLLMKTCSERWKSASEQERLHCEQLANEDRERYNEECRVRDEEALRLQEERRKQHSVGETETRMRGTTIASSDAAVSKDTTKRKRELSEKEREMHQNRKEAKIAEQEAQKKEMAELARGHAVSAEARLKYLLSQSDVFGHFGIGKEFKEQEEAKKAAPTGRRGHRADRGTVEEMDDDERAMAHEIGEGEDGEGDVDDSKQTILLQQPSMITGGKLREYQLEGLNWMIRLHENGINGILADEMGLGKTLQSISILSYMYEYKKVTGPHIVLVPKSTLSNWCNEFARFTPAFRVLCFHGNKEDRQHLLETRLKPAHIRESRDWDVLITTYEILNLEKGPLSKIAWRYLIIDEAHRLKNEESMFAKTVRMMMTENRLLLTGTPLQNNLHELWALLNFLLPDVFSSSEQFDEWFNLEVNDTEVKQRMISQLHKLLRPFMLRRLKVDVEKSLPPKSEIILFTSMSEVQRNLYKNILRRNIDEINNVNGSNSEQSRTAILNIVMQLRKCCNHPYLFPNIEDRSLNPLGDHLHLSCGKMVLLHKLLIKMKERGHRVLIFTQMTRMLDILEDYLFSMGYLYCRIDGNTSYEDREDRIADFNRPDSDRFIFLLSTRAGGLGINLQTADTVILYDSDWNPQADLQAQDRAHRIGQKKPVQVFRLVTDDSVEVKVVERAQQKLKLDAMVVQQGRLQEKEKKMSKADLMDTLRFGADKIFRNKESAISDADIDMILEEGKKRTAEMNEKLQVADKGDMFDFRLDGGMEVQVFEGKDYSAKARESASSSSALGGDFFFLDIGKRDRRAVNAYADVQKQTEGEGEKKAAKLPKHLKLPKMDDWQFFDRKRLQDLHAMELKLFEELVEKGEAPPAAAMGKLVLLPVELQEEKMRLLEEAFVDWSKADYQNFYRACGKYGRSEFEKIAKDVGKSVDDVKRYSQAFWIKGKDMVSNFESVVRNIEKGEKKLEEIDRLTVATAKLIGMFDDPWEELSFRSNSTAGRVFTSVEDRYLLCLTHLHGYGNWDEVRNSIRRSERFRFDFYLQSCSTETIGKRCENLMRLAEKELIELERKKQQSESAGPPQPKFQSETTKQRVSELTKQIAEEARKLAVLRKKMDSLKKQDSGPAVKLETKFSEVKEANDTEITEKDVVKEKKERRASGPPCGAVADFMMPTLCKLIEEAGFDGIAKIVERFVDIHSDVPKRQVEMKINEISSKEKHEKDSRPCWHLKPEFVHFLAAEAAVSTPAADVAKGTPKSAIKTPKRKRDEGVKEEKDSDKEDLQTNSTAKKPKKFKRAFGLFVKDHRIEAEKELGDIADKTEALKELLAKKWEQADQETKKKYELEEEIQKARYEQECAAFNSNSQK